MIVSELIDALRRANPDASVLLYHDPCRAEQLPGSESEDDHLMECESVQRVRWKVTHRGLESRADDHAAYQEWADGEEGVLLDGPEFL